MIPTDKVQWLELLALGMDPLTGILSSGDNKANNNSLIKQTFKWWVIPQAPSKSLKILDKGLIP